MGMTTTPNLRSAVATVVEDQRQSYPEMTVADAVNHAINTTDPSDLDEDAGNADAYRMVHRAYGETGFPGKAFPELS